MTKTLTKTLVAASLIVAGLASSAYASDASEVLHQQANQPAVQQRTVTAQQAYAYAPAQYTVATSAEQREFNRVDFDTVSSR